MQNDECGMLLAGVVWASGHPSGQRHSALCIHHSAFSSRVFAEPSPVQPLTFPALPHHPAIMRPQTNLLLAARLTQGFLA